MTAVAGGPPEVGSPTDGPRGVTDSPTRIDRAFGALTTSAGVTVLAILGMVGLFLLIQSRRAFDIAGWSFFTRVEWRTDTVPPEIGVLGLVCGTTIVAVIAVTLAVPMGVCTALFITDYSSPRVRRFLTGAVDLLAAIPSLLYGIWGFLYLGTQIQPLSAFLARHLGWIPIFDTEPEASLVGSMFIAGIVVSLMVLPIIASISREVFSQAPPAEKEAALALGGTRWGMVRQVVIPYGKGGIVGGAMLGLGRALGETIAVSLLLPQVPELTARILQNGGATVSGFIVQRAGGDDITVSGLMAAGLVLFVLTLVTNMFASTVIARSRSGVGVDA